MLKTYKRTFVVFCIFLIPILMIGCEIDKYQDFSADFNKVYVEVASFVDIGDTMQTLENFQSEENEVRIDIMKDLIANIKNNVPKSKKQHYERIQQWYQGVELIRESYNKWDTLSPDEKGQVLSEILQVEMRKENIINGKWK